MENRAITGIFGPANSGDMLSALPSALAWKAPAAQKPLA
jgi:hypothetical protein